MKPDWRCCVFVRVQTHNNKHTEVHTYSVSSTHAKLVSITRHGKSKVFTGSSVHKAVPKGACMGHSPSNAMAHVLQYEVQICV